MTTTESHPVPEVLDATWFDDTEQFERSVKWLHENAPVYYYDPKHRYPQKLWIISKAADIRMMSAAPHEYASRFGATLDHIAFTPPDDPRWDVAIRMSTMIDPPDHDRHRTLIMQHFKPRRFFQMEEQLRKVVNEVLDDVEDPTQPIDLHREFAAKVPLWVTLDLLGVDRQHAPLFAHWKHLVFEMFQPGFTCGPEVFLEMFDFFEAEIDDRLRNPKEDLITDIVNSKGPNGELFSRDEMIMWCWTIMVGGQDTTSNMLSGGIKALMDWPEEKAKLLDNPGLIPAGIEEMLRWTTPERYMKRTSMKDQVLRGVEIAEGDAIYMFYLAANRDPDEFEDPWTFRISEKRSKHITFGAGQHFCIGSALARTEGVMAITELLRRYPDFAQAGDWVPQPHLQIPTWAESPVILDPK